MPLSSHVGTWNSRHAADRPGTKLAEFRSRRRHFAPSRTSFLSVINPISSLNSRQTRSGRGTKLHPVFSHSIRACRAKWKKLKTTEEASFGFRVASCELRVSWRLATRSSKPETHIIKLSKNYATMCPNIITNAARQFHNFFWPP